MSQGRWPGEGIETCFIDLRYTGPLEQFQQKPIKPTINWYSEESALIESENGTHGLIRKCNGYYEAEFFDSTARFHEWKFACDTLGVALDWILFRFQMRDW